MSSNTLLFLDTEFSHLVGVSELLSLALVSEDGNWEFYVERTDVPLSHCSEFVREVVLPLFGRILGAAGSLRDLRSGLGRFLHSLPGRVQVGCDYAPDFELLRTAVGLPWPPHLSPRRLKLEEWQLEPHWAVAEEDFYRPGRPRHHALEDARALRAGYLAWRSHLARDPGEES